MDLSLKANIVRALCLISTTEAGSGHPTSCLSAADIISVLFDKYFTYDLKHTDNIHNDKLIYSKGHAAPLLYSAFALAGAYSPHELLTLRKFGSRFEGHPTPRFEYADISTGSLGQGLSVSAGMALAAKKDSLSKKIFVLMGDGEIAEGQIYEACNFASVNKLDNLIGIIDINSLGQTGKTAFGYDLSRYENLFYSLGMHTIVIDGHNNTQIDRALDEAVNNKTGLPVMIIAKTVKGKGISFLENKEDMHGKTLSNNDLEKALKELSLSKNIINKKQILFKLKEPSHLSSRDHAGNMARRSKTINNKVTLSSSRFLAVTSRGHTEISTREAFGDALVELGKANNNIFVVDGDVSNSTYTDKFKKEFPDRFVQGYIAEQNMVSVAVGLSAAGKIPFVSTFGAFLTRAFDQIRMAHLSGLNIKFIGSHAGVSIGEDGPSQMALEDMAMFSSSPEAVVLHPCDRVSTVRLVNEMVLHKGISYLRTLRGKTPVIYSEKEEFKIGGSKVLKSNKEDKLVVVTAGITVHEALKAYELLKKKKINTCIIDAYSVRPIDKETILKCVRNSKLQTVITIEDHSINGGLGDAVLSALAQENVKVIKMGIEKIPYSGKPVELLHEFGIDAKSIVDKVIRLFNH